jgi:predicted Rossmann fold flavoprotein
MSDWQAVVIGGGAAGLLAAIRAAERGRKTLLVEKNKRPGVKILMSGGTRCNLTHACGERGIVEAFGARGKFLHSALAALGPRDLVELIEAEGVLTKTESTGKIFPVSDRAADVLSALLRRLERSGCVLAAGEPVKSVEAVTEGQSEAAHAPDEAEPRGECVPRRSPGTSGASLGTSGTRFRIVTDHRALTADSVLITTGGCSYPGSGTTGDGYAWAAGLGHTIVPPRPALVPVTTDAAWVHALRGLTVPDVFVAVRPRSDAARTHSARPVAGQPPPADILAERRGSFLFTHFGLSGPAVLDVSQAITCRADPASVDLVCDFLPSVSEHSLDEQLRKSAVSAGGKPVLAILPGQLARRLIEALLKLADVPPDLRAAELGKAARGRVIPAIKGCRIAVAGTLGFKKAEVTAGGVALEEVDSRTMQSRLVSNLYLAGEILDLDGPIGGYNFQAAFSTGWLAGGCL